MKNQGLLWGKTRDEYTFWVHCRQLTDEERKIVEEMLPSFPAGFYKNWAKGFEAFDPTKYNKELLAIAANAINSFGLRVLGSAADCSSIWACKKLLEMGADINALDYNNKLPLHWAICSVSCVSNNKSIEAAAIVKFLLDNGARTDIVCYDNMTPFGYAESRDYEGAAKLIRAHNKLRFEAAVTGALSHLFPAEICCMIALLIDWRETHALRATCIAAAH